MDVIEFLQDIFLYHEKSPLIFTKMFFWLFFAVVLFGYSFIYNRPKLRSLYLFIVSLFFYYKSSGFFFILLVVNIIINYFIGNAIHKTDKDRKRTTYLVISVFVNLFILSYFKYTFFFVDAFNSMFGTHIVATNYLAELSNMFFGTSFNLSKIFLPVGISFFTFQTMSYTIDIYRRKLEPVKNIIDFGFYVSFFPQLVAGPIVRASEFVPQIYQKYSLTRYEFGMAVFMILKGLIKKIVIGDYIAVNFIDRIFTNPDMYTGFESLMAMFGYSLQLYCDFSGYTDIAIGVALLMGFRLSKNFDSPYKSKNCSEFWTRWHISLSSWLKDYLYIPLGGNRKATIGTYLNFGFILLVIILMASSWIVTAVVLSLAMVLFLLIMFVPSVANGINSNINRLITMLLGGMWHGSSWNFLVWGGLNGVGLIFDKYWQKISPLAKIKGKFMDFVRILMTFLFITVTWVFFRSQDTDTAITMFQNVFSNPFQNALDVIVAYKKVFIIMAFGFLTHWLSGSIKDSLRDKFIASPHWVQAIVVLLVAFVVYQSICADMQPFIYFQF